MKRHAPATERNREPIAEVLARELPRSGLVLEIASGTGEHAVYFASRFPQLVWQPSDPDEGALESIAAWSADYRGENLLEPVQLDASAPDWPVAQAQGVLCINMVHISPWPATLGLFKGSSSLLARGEPLIIYGPFLEVHVDTAPSNLAFDASLKARNPHWGLRSTSQLSAVADQAGFASAARYEMPANNLMLVYRRL